MDEKLHYERLDNMAGYRITLVECLDNNVKINKFKVTVYTKQGKIVTRTSYDEYYVAVKVYRHTLKVLSEFIK